MDHPGDMTEATTATMEPPGATPSPRKAGGHGWLWGLTGLAVVGGIAAFALRGREHTRAHAVHGESATPRGVAVDAAHPRPGGMVRSTTQAASVHAFEHASLFAKLSGYLIEQSVDIGDRVKQGQLLAVIDAPEVDKAVDQSAAALDQAKARVAVAESKIRTARADKAAADALVRQCETDVAAKVSNQDLQQKQLNRITGLVQRNAVEAKLRDEQQDRLDVATSDLGVSRATVLTAQAQAMSKAAMIESAEADLAEAKSDVEIALANLARAKVFQDYKRIVSPYDGVITVRSFHRGDFVRSASEGGIVPVLAVAVTEKMRVILPVPDTDVPFLDVGDPATFEVAALPGQKFESKVARFNHSEDPQSRTMRTEVDIMNADGRLREGMYGRMTVVFQPASPGGMTIPSPALMGQTGAGVGTVYVARDGKARKVTVQVSKDNGVTAEVVGGLTPQDLVIYHYNGAIDEGTPVAVGPVADKATAATH